MASPKATDAGAPAIPETMKAAAIDRFGPPDVLTLHTLPVPVPGATEVLIAVHAAGVGIWDAGIRSGAWAGGNERFPRVLGTDGAGTVAAMGSEVHRFGLGDRVWAYEFESTSGGFYAEYVAVDADHMGHVPERMDLLEAGASAVTGLTALQGIDDHLQVRPGETVLVYGATGAVGTLAVQFAKRHRARVLATATGEDARALALELGADEVFDARNDAELDRLDALAPDGIDAVLALADGEALERYLDRVRPGGRVAHPNGVQPEPGDRKNVRKIAYDAVAGRDEFARLESAAVEAKLRVPLAAVYPLAEAAEAHRRLEQGHVLGRIVLRIRGEESR